MSEHRLIVVGSQLDFVELVKEAKARGYYTIVCDGYPNGPAKAYADKSYNIDVRNVDEFAAMCITEKADGIIGSFSDLLFEQITKIADKAGLPWYAKPEMIKYYREKNIAKDALMQLGVNVPKHCLLKKDFCDEELKDFHFPLVIKPVNGYGSKGIFVVKSAEEIRKKFDSVIMRSTMEEIEVEEYSPGKEYNMMTWLIDGKVHVISIADRQKNPQEGDEIPLLNRTAYPSKDIGMVMDEAVEVLNRFSAYTGQRDGALCMQFFYNEKGVEVCEIAGRLFGYENGLTMYCSGLSIEKMLLDYVYDKPALQNRLEKHNPYFENHCAALYYKGVQGKRIKDQSAARRLAEDPSIMESVLFYEDGEVIDNYGPKPYLARYYIKANTRQELDEATKRFFEEFSVKADDGSEASYRFIMEE